MYQYLKITNQGLICEEDLMLIGSSSKRDDQSKIGMFGSGWKYALAWLIRNDCTPNIFSGNNQIEVDYRASVHRNNPVRIITINGKETSLTAEMGPQWTGWMAVREVVSNAIDEGNYQVTTEMNPLQQGEEGKTTVYIPMIKELREMMMSYDRYFAFDREPDAINSIGKIFLKTRRSECAIYRKDIRCYDNAEATFLDYSFHNIRINESRLASFYDIKSQVSRIIASGNITSAILKAYIIDSEGSDDYAPKLNNNLTECLVELAESGIEFTTKSMRNLFGALSAGADALTIPSEWYNEMVRLGYCKSMLSFLDGTNIPFVETNKRGTSVIANYLSKFNIHVPVISGKFEGYDMVIFTGQKAVVHDNHRGTDKQIASELLSKLRPHHWEELL